MFVARLCVPRMLFTDATVARNDKDNEQSNKHKKHVKQTERSCDLRLV